MDFKAIKTILDEIKETSSRNEKEMILKRESGNELLKDFLDLLYNPYVVMGLGKKNLEMSPNDGKRFETVEALIKYLKTRNSHTNESIQCIVNTIDFLSGGDLDLKKFLIEVVSNTYKCGITAKTINKAFGYPFIPEHSIMLAERLDIDKAYKTLKETKVCHLSLKLDGVRGTLVKENEKILFLARSGNVYEGLEELTVSAKRLPDGHYDGELLYHDESGEMTNDEVRRMTTSIANTKGVKRGLKFVIFDLPSEGDKTVYERKQILQEMALPPLIEALPIIRTIHFSEVNSPEDFNLILEEEFKKVRVLNQEGIMINFEASYQKKRTKYLMKVKDQFTADLRVIDYFLGEGEFDGLLGGFVVELPIKGANYPVKVGSGFTLDQRKEFIQNPSFYIGKIIEVKATEVSQNKDGGYSLSYPVFLGLRLDKDEVNLEIKID